MTYFLPSPPSLCVSFSLCVSISLSLLCLSLYLSPLLSVSLSLCLSVSFFLCLCLSLSISLCPSLSFSPSISLSFSPSLSLSLSAVYQMPVRAKLPVRRLRLRAGLRELLANGPYGRGGRGQVPHRGRLLREGLW